MRKATNKRHLEKHKPEARFNSSDQEDLRALASIQQGNSQAFAVIFKKYRPYLYFGILKKVKNPSLAEDLVMEIFEKSYENILEGKYDSEYTFNSWLTKVASNYVIDYIRKKKKNPVLSPDVVYIDSNFGLPAGEDREVQPLEIESNLPGPMENTDDMQHQIRSEFVFQTIRSLPKIDREVLELRYHEDLSYQDIADRLGVGLSAIKLRMKRAKSLLQTVIDRDKGESLAQNTYSWEALESLV